MLTESKTDASDAPAADASDHGTTDPAIRPASAGLSLIALPRIDPDAFAGLYVSLNELMLAFDDLDRKRIGSWLLFANNAGLVSEMSIKKALHSNTPCTLLTRLAQRAMIKLHHRLNSEIKEVCPSSQYWNSVHISLNEESTSMRVGFDSIYYIDVKSLRRLPEPLSGIVYGSLRLAQEALFPCLMPHDMVTGECSWHIEAAKEEYKILVSEGMADDLDQAARYIRQNEDKGMFEYLSGYEDIQSALRMIKEACQGAPEWMKTCPNKGPVWRWRDLAHRLDSWLRQHKDYSRHPWVQYTRCVVRVMSREFPNKKAWDKYRADLDRLWIHDQFEGDMYLSNGVIVSTGTNIEKFIADEFDQQMMQAGETPAAHFVIDPLADSPLCLILERMALGIGLLLQAGCINSEIMKEVEQ